MNTGRWLKLWMALIVPGFDTWSVGIAEVSDVPGRACEYIWYSSESYGIPEPSSSEMRRYWLPTAPLMFSHFGRSGSAGGLSGSNAMWQEPQEVPIRNGGSIEPSASRRTRESADFGSADTVFAKPSQLARPPFAFCQRARSKRGFGNLR